MPIGNAETLFAAQLGAGDHMRSWLRRVISSTVTDRNRAERNVIARIRKSGFFDEKWYLEQYPDVLATGQDPLRHFLRQGGLHGRNPSPLFNSTDYLEAYPDVRSSGINPLVHFLKWGRDEGRFPLPFGRPDPITETISIDEGPRYVSVLDKLAEAAQARLEPAGQSREYDVIRSEFDIAFYLTRYDDIAQNNLVDPIRHYIDYGAKQGRDPSPDFSTLAYLDRYPDVRKSGVNPFFHWLTEGRSAKRFCAPHKKFGELCGMLDQPPHVLQEILSHRRRDIKNRIDRGALGEMVVKAVEFEPLISHTWSKTFDIKQPPFASDTAVSAAVAMHRLHDRAHFRRATFVLAVNRPRWGGTRRMEGHLAHALAEMYEAGEVLVVSTDVRGEMPAGKFPDGCRYVDFADITVDFEAEVREQIFIAFLFSLRATSVFNINSRLLWDTMSTFGRELSANSDIYACMFCNEQNRFGHWTGYPVRNFAKFFDQLRGICTDSHALADWLSTQYKVAPDKQAKITVLSAPIDPTIEAVPAPAPALNRRPQVFWSGRFDRQKRIDIVYALAERMPRIDFRMWGEAVLDNAFRSLEKPANVFHEGVYKTFDELPLDQCDLWLYTSEWDGVPSILLELSMTGVPIVGSLAGGTVEILKTGLSWPVANINDIEEYESAIEDILRDPVAARDQALRLRRKMLLQRTTEAYRSTLRMLLQSEPSNERN